MDYLYGKLNNEVKYREYKGSETTTATVTIDDSSTVSVDVKKVPNELTLTTINGDTYTYDGSEPASFDIRTQVTDKVEEGNNLPVTSDSVKGYVDSKAGALEYVGGEGKFTNINGGVTVKGRLNVDDGIYSPVNSDDPNFVPNNKSVDDKITASEQKLIDERIGAFTRTADKLFTDVEGGMTVKGHLNVDGGITSASAPTSYKDVTNKGYVDGSRLFYIGTTSIKSAIHDDTGTHLKSSTIMRTKSGLDYQGSTEMLIPIVGKDGVIIENDSDSIVAVKADGEAIQKDMAGRFGNNSLWYTSTTGEPSGFGVTDAGDSGAIPVITDGLRLPETIPDENYVAVHKKYVDDGFVKSVAGPTGNAVVYVRGVDGTDKTASLERLTISDFSVVQRSEGGVVRVGAPVAVNDATTKKYVDDADAKKLNLTGGTITGSLAIQGDLTVTGTTTTEKTQTLAVKDSVIITNADGAELGATLSGIAIKKDGENTYGVMYDPSGDSVKLGLGTLDAENKFTFNESGTDGKPIATRADSSALTDGDLVKWDGTTNSLVDSGKKTDDFVPKVTVTEGSNLAYIAHFGGGQGTIPVEVVPIRGSLVQRTVDGIVKVGTPVNENDATTKKYVDDKFVAKVTTTSGSNLAYIAKNDGTQSTVPIAQMPYQNTVAQRGAGGTLKVGKAVEDSDAMPKKQVEDNFVKSYVGTPATTKIYVRTNAGVDSTVTLNTRADDYSVAQRGIGGVLQVGKPTADNHASTKKYVDDADSKKVNLIDGLTAGAVVYATETANGTTIGIPYSANTTDSDSIVQRQQNGVIVVGTPTSDATDAAVNVGYANANYAAKLTQPYVVYLNDGEGKLFPAPYNYQPYHDAVVCYDGIGCLRTNDPNGDDERLCVNKKYANAHYVKSYVGTSGTVLVYIRQGDHDSVVSMNVEPGEGTVAQRRAGGALKVGTAVEDSDAMTKKQVEDGFVKKGTSNSACYCIDYTGSENMVNYSIYLDKPYTLAQRDVDYTLKVGTPVGVSDATTKKYVDDGFVAKVTPSNNLTYVYSRDENGDKSVQATSMMTGNTLAYRDANGNIGVGTPTEDAHATTKKYVDDRFVAKQTTTAPNQSYLYGYDSNGDRQFGVTSAAAPFTLAYRSNGGRLKVGTAVECC